jgi:citrate lyase alpha subunit
MVLTAAQTTAFFENGDQMGITHATVVQLATDGIMSLIDLDEFDKESVQQLADNLRRP